MQREMAETVAAQALGWLAGDADLLGTFMGATGVGPGDLRARAASPAFLAGVLDFVMQDDAWVIGFCDAAGLPHDTLLRARAALPGGEQVHWT